MNTNTTLKIKFNENLSDSSIKMIKELLKGSLGFETEIAEVDSSVEKELYSFIIGSNLKNNLMKQLNDKNNSAKVHTWLLDGVE